MKNHNLKSYYQNKNCWEIEGCHYRDESFNTNVYDKTFLNAFDNVTMNEMTKEPSVGNQMEWKRLT